MAFEIAKVDEAQRLVFGYANVSITKDGRLLEDVHRDSIDPEELEKAAYEFVLHFRESGEMHDRGVVKGATGRLVESMVFTPEKLEKLGLPKDSVPTRWWVGFKLDPTAFAKVKSGVYQMFSIQGHAERVEDGR